MVLSSDHLIKNNEKFIKVLNKGLKYARNNFLVTFGEVPTTRNRLWIYKSRKAFMNDEIIGNKIEEFTEKPNLKSE